MRPSRRSLLIAAAVAVLVAVPGAALGRRSSARAPGSPPWGQMQSILQAKGSVSNGVLQVGIDRDDIHGVRLRGVPVEPSWELSGDFDFQSLGGGRVFFNGDIPLKESEVNPVIDALLAHHLTFQAEHQHFYDFHPEVWFIHFRGSGKALDVARRVHAVIKATSTPLPQAPPAHPSTPLDPDKLKSILHGDSAEVEHDGVVSVSIPRKDAIHIAGRRVKPETNVETTVRFQPEGSGAHSAVAPDFALEAPEIDRVMRQMRSAGWDIGCLYNQETDEFPQLYFSHQDKVGDAYSLARQIRKGLDLTNSD